MSDHVAHLGEALNIKGRWSCAALSLYLMTGFHCLCPRPFPFFPLSLPQGAFEGWEAGMAHSCLVQFQQITARNEQCWCLQSPGPRWLAQSVVSHITLLCVICCEQVKVTLGDWIQKETPASSRKTATAQNPSYSQGLLEETFCQPHLIIIRGVNWFYSYVVTCASHFFIGCRKSKIRK